MENLNVSRLNRSLNRSLRRPLEEASGSFHQSFNGSSVSINLNLSSRTPGKKSFINDSINKSGSSNKSINKNRANGGDRFIPDRSNFELAHYLIQSHSQSTNDLSSSNKESSSSIPIPGSQINIDSKVKKSVYSRSLTETMLGVSDLDATRVLTFSQKPKAPPEGYQNPLKVVYQGSAGVNPSNLGRYRVLPKSPERVLDAPDVADDFYLNVLAWSKSNVIAIALRDQCYLWTAHNAKIDRLGCDLHDTNLRAVTSVDWVENGIHAICGLDTGNIQIWDAEKMKLIRTFRTGDNSRIGSLALNAHILTEGNRMGTLRNHDLRVQNHEICKIELAHSQEICGLKWSHDGRFLASGGNDNHVHVWDSTNMHNNSRPFARLTDHLAAVKALAWSPSHQSILSTGGGTNDRSIKIWNVSSGSLLKSVDCESQVSGLIWHDSYREIISSHGFTKHQLTVWKYPDMSKVGDIMGHAMRVLTMVLSPDETTVATVGADETLRFWRVFPPTKATADLRKKKKDPMTSFQTIR